MTSASIEASLQYLDLLFNVVVVCRLIQLRLYSVYPVFFVFLCVPMVMQSGAVAFGTGSDWFLGFFTVLEPIRSILYILVVFELFSLIFRNYAGLRSLSRWVMGVAAAVAMLIVILTAAMTGTSEFSASEFVRRFLPIERGIAFGLVIIIIILLYFISRFPIKLPRNSVVLCMLYSFWFLSDAAVLVVATLNKDYRFLVNDALAVLEIGSYLGWALLLSKSGEFQETRVRRDISPDTERALIGELDAMNQLLLRAGRSISRTH
jgi:hypothetical protein